MCRLGVDFVLPLSQEQEQQEQQEEPLTRDVLKGLNLTHRLLMGFWLILRG